MSEATGLLLVAWFVVMALIGTMKWASDRPAIRRRRDSALSAKSQATLLLVRQVREQMGIWSLAGGTWPIREPTLRRKIIYWRGVCVDTTSYALHALRKCQELHPSRRVEAWLDARREAISGFLEANFSRSQGTYRLKEDNWATVYTEACALHALRVLSPQYESRKPLYQLEGAIARERLQKIQEFVLRCQSPEYGLGERPGWKPTWADCNAGYHTAIWNLGDDPKVKAELLPHAMAFADACWHERAGVGGFSDTPDEPAATCSSAFALLSLSYLANGNRKVIEPYETKVKNFFAECKRGGGFSWEPGEQASIVHTRLVLGCLCEALDQSQGNDRNRLADLIRDLVDPKEVVAYAEETLQQGGAGFLIGSPENVFATRAALQVLALVNRHVEGTRIENVDWEKTSSFIVRLYDERLRGFKGYPSSEVLDSDLSWHLAVPVSP